MRKNVVFCADGTWNHPGEMDNGLAADTNVYKFFKSLPLNATQSPHYDDGVGVGGTPIDQLLGGAIGDGLFAKVKEGYAFVSHAYADGDRIFLFGFSRGAYTARSLAGMIAACGIPAPDKLNDQAIKDAFDAYRTRTSKDAKDALISGLQQRYGNRKVEIAMVGVWDTVGALGIPGNVFSRLDDQFYGFLDTALNINVKAAYHAVSIDERRREFVATLWDALSAEAVAAGNTLEQVWFAGVHCDVGGGYAETGLSDIALSWMMHKAGQRGLQFDPGALAQYTGIAAKHALDTLHASWSPLWGFPARRAVPGAAAIANSVAIRVEYAAAGYRPPNLTISLGGQLLGYQIETVVPDPPGI